MAQYLFLESSRAARKQFTALFDFVWPTAVGMWNLRWQVCGYVAVRPSATKAELAGRFAAGSGIPRANLERSCLQHSWEEQQEQFARFLLVNLCALYESWIASALLELKSTGSETGLQFATAAGKQKNPGVWPTVRSITHPESTIMRDAFYPGLLTNRRNSKQNLDDLLRCYRYFKEIRNGIAHNGGRAKSTAVTAYREFFSIASTSALGVKEIPAHEPILNEGDQLKLHLRGVVALAEIILKIIATLDAEFSRAQHAEDVFCTRWLAMYGRKHTLRTKDQALIEQQIARLCKGLDLPSPAISSQMEGFLRQRRLVG